MGEIYWRKSVAVNHNVERVNMALMDGVESLPKPQLIDQINGGRMNRVTAKVTKEVTVFLQHHGVDTGTREQKPEHHAGRSASHNAAPSGDRRAWHGGPFPSDGGVHGRTRATLTLMASTLLVLALIFSTIAALVHVFIFALESVLWAKPPVWRKFGLRSQADADLMESMAFNQGFYNLFLALGTLVGLFLLAWGNPVAGKWVLLVALSSMALASVVLVVSHRKLWRAALVQGVAPLLGIVFLLGAVMARASMTVI